MPALLEKAPLEEISSHGEGRVNPLPHTHTHTHRGSLQVRSSLSVNGVNYSPCHQNLQTQTSGTQHSWKFQTALRPNPATTSHGTEGTPVPGNLGLNTAGRSGRLTIIRLHVEPQPQAVFLIH